RPGADREEKHVTHANGRPQRNSAGELDFNDPNQRRLLADNCPMQAQHDVGGIGLGAAPMPSCPDTKDFTLILC
ncbi:MAG TPA: hypothetical protein VME69_12555, partial [Methylocella sp.]|nr:hypothetical protein [Methylocella sp.]